MFLIKPINKRFCFFVNLYCSLNMSDKNKIEAIMNRSIGSSQKKGRADIELKNHKKCWYRDKYIFFISVFCNMMLLLYLFININHSESDSNSNVPVEPAVWLPDYCLDTEACKIEELLVADGPWTSDKYISRMDLSYSKFLHFVENSGNHAIKVYISNGVRLDLYRNEILIRSGGDKTIYYDQEYRKWTISF